MATEQPPFRPRGRLTYRAVFQVDDCLDAETAEAVAKRLGPPAVSAAIDTALHRLLADWPLQSRPSLGAVSVAAHTLDSAPLDPDGPFATPDGQMLLASFLAELLAWDDDAGADGLGGLPRDLYQRARGLLAGVAAPDDDRNPPAEGWTPGQPTAWPDEGVG
jgi:hypothetical protein